MDLTRTIKESFSYLKKLKQLTFFSLDNFFIENPALIYSLYFLLGTIAKLEAAYSLFALPLLCGFKKTKVIAFAIFSFSFLYCHLYYPSFPIFEEAESFSATVKITSITTSSNFKKGYLYKGRVNQIELKDGKKYKNIPCNIHYKGKKLSANTLYRSSGTAVVSSNSKFNLSLKAKEMIPIKKNFSFVDIRNKIKEKTDKEIKKLVQEKDAANFLSGLVTGSLSDSFLSFSFRKVGLQHILAISGFHFSMLILFFMFFLKKILPHSLLPFILIFVTNAYFFYIGFAPSIFRAYCCLQIAFIAQLVNKKNSSINTLGLCVIVELLLDPLNMLNLGFQLSFLSVLAIFIIYPHISILISYILKKRSKEDLRKLDFFSKIGGWICNFLREGFSLTIAVNLALIPVLLYYFSSFPLISILYNLFFPPLIFIPVLLLALAFFFSLFHLHFLSASFGFITSAFTELILKFITSPPSLLQYNLYLKGIDSLTTTCLITLIFLSFIILRYMRKSPTLYPALELI